MHTPLIEGIYATQPIKYPDGNYYLKLGANTPNDMCFTSELVDIKNRFANGDSDANIPILKEHLLKIIPDLKIKNILSKRCILTRTKHPLENPYIGILKKDRSFLAVGNGWSGGNSDGVGFIAATLAMNGIFPKSFFEKDFTPIYSN